MRYFLKKTNHSKKGLYLQIYKSMYVPGKGGRNLCHESLGYACDLIKDGIKDPEKYAQEKIDKLNENIPNLKEKKIGDISIEKNLGHFLLKSMWNYLELDDDYNTVSMSKNFHFKMSDFLQSMIYSQIVNPGSKHKAFEKVMPNLFEEECFSYDQILDTINFVGNDYQKFIEIMNHHIEDKFSRKTDRVYFDCTNYYFEIDLPKEGRQHGPSKEERHLPIMGQALLLDENQIPLGMSLYPGNESEKPKIRETIEDLKQRFNIDKKIVQIADKGLNCARNIYAATKEARDGYIFSRAIHGTGLNSMEKKWLILEEPLKNNWTNVIDKNGKLLYRYKECIDDFEYKFKDENNKDVIFKVREKRVVSYNPALAKKQIAQINKQINKATTLTSIKQNVKEEYGDSIKYVNFTTVNENGEIIKPIPALNNEKIDEDLSLAGYNLLVTSEVNKSAQEIYNAYHGLWRIEESFRIMKTYLEARPVFLQKLESIYGHFLICYLGLVLLRLIELKVFNDELPISQIIEFIREYKIAETPEKSFMNLASKTSVLKEIKTRYSLSKLDNAYLAKKDALNILNSELYFD